MRDQTVATARYDLVAVLFLTGIGTVIRALSVVSEGFPLNDGGLFYQMVLDLRQEWPLLPEVTTYNGIDAPFAYPPLAFYLGAALHGLLGVDVLRVVPLVAASMTVPAFYLLARSILGAGLYAVAATTAFALMPRTFEWMTMGGGLTRAPGLLFAILALWLTHRTLTKRGIRSPVGAGVAGGLVALTHPQATLFVILSGFLIVAWHARDRRALQRLGLAVGVAGLIALPWVLAIVVRGQVDAIASASGTQPGPFIGLLSLLSFDVTGSRLFDVTGLFAAVGLLLGVVRGRWLVPLWFVLVMVLDARGGATYAAVPASILAGMAFVDILVRPLWLPQADPPVLPRRLPPLRGARSLLGAALFALALVDAVGSQRAPGWSAVAVAPDQRAAMDATDPAADYLVVTGRTWARDAVAEWFPVLSGAHSAGTVQGHEWLGRGHFRERLAASEDLRACADATPACLDEWSADWDTVFTHVFLPKGSVSGPLGAADCCTGLRELLRRDSGYEVVYDGAGATIFERTDG